MNILEKILFFFGLVTVKRAKHINEEMVAARERTIMEDARKDFGVSALDGFEQAAREWANETFDDTIALRSGAFITESEWLQGYLDGYDPRVSVISRTNNTVVRI